MVGGRRGGGGCCFGSGRGEGRCGGANDGCGGGDVGEAGNGTVAAQLQLGWPKSQAQRSGPFA